MHPYLVDVGFFQIRIYGLMIAAAILVAAFMLNRRAESRGLPWADKTWELVFWSIIGGIIGARIWEVIFTWDWYRARPQEIFAVWHGGISIQGAILGGLVVFAVWAAKHRVDLWQLLDLAAGPVVLAQGIGRVGCLFNGDAFSRPIGETWLPAWLGVRYAPGTPAYWMYGNQALVPAEAFEGLADFAIAAVLLFYRPKHEVSGWRALAYGVSYSAVRFLLEFWRADSLLTGGGLKVAQLLAVIIFTVSAVLWVGKAVVARTAQHQA